MKQNLLLPLAALLLLLCACQGPEAEVSPSLSPAPSPTASAETESQVPDNLPDFVAQFTFTQLEVLSTESGELEYLTYSLDEEARSEIQSLLAMDSWTETEIPEQSLESEYV